MYQTVTDTTLVQHKTLLFRVVPGLISQEWRAEKATQVLSGVSLLELLLVQTTEIM